MIGSKTFKKKAFLALCVALLCSLFGVQRAEAQELISTVSSPEQLVALTALTAQAAPENTRAMDFSHARLGVWTDSGIEYYTKILYPEAECVYLDGVSNMTQNLIQGKIDGFLMAKTIVDNLRKEGVAIDYLPDTLCAVPCVYAFTVSERGQRLRQEMNAFLADIKSDGTLASLHRKWMEGDERERTFTKATLTGENGTITVGSSAETVPYSYMKDNELTGFEIEIIDLFCAARGYRYEVKTNNFDAMLADVSLGKTDIGASYIEWLPDREGNVLFSDPTDEGYCVMVVPSEEVSETGFLSWLKRGFVNTLIVEDRWQMIVEGMSVTVLITIFAALLGTLLGFLVYLLYREGLKLVNKAIDASVTALQGVPDLILLMFFYYVVFGSVNVSGTVVAIIAFGIMLSVAVFIMLRSGSESIHKGQMEAALALGFSERRAYLKFILPQVATVFFPTYKKALVDMMLSTAIVGYVAVQDLTRMGDLIRARTFDAFVPLIVVSIIYFLLSWLMLKGMGALLTRLNPRNRKPEKIIGDLEIGSITISK